MGGTRSLSFNRTLGAHGTFLGASPLCDPLLGRGHSITQRAHLACLFALSLAGFGFFFALGVNSGLRATRAGLRVPRPWSTKSSISKGTLRSEAAFATARTRRVSLLSA